MEAVIIYSRISGYNHLHVTALCKIIDWSKMARWKRKQKTDVNTIIKTENAKVCRGKRKSFAYTHAT